MQMITIGLYQANTHRKNNSLHWVSSGSSQLPDCLDRMAQYLEWRQPRRLANQCRFAEVRLDVARCHSSATLRGVDTERKYCHASSLRRA